MNRFLEQLPPDKGTYILYTSLSHELALSIGVLGEVRLPAANYIYIGSAFGSGGIRARVKHHLQPSIKPHWHFDYLKPHLAILAVLWQSGTKHLECAWVRQLCQLPQVSVPAAGLGASDCRSDCPAHLLSVPCCYGSIAQRLQIDHTLEFMYNNQAPRTE